jgi:hypothetical protein
MGRVTDKTEAFADDNNILARLDNLTLQAIKEILNNFAILSGLRCNVDKSQILLMGVNEIPNYVTESGFTVSDGIKILGFNITKLPLDCINNFDPAVEKIKQLITFWNRFRLSLPGRINVAKTLMLSQIGFYSAILDVPDEKIQEVQKLLDNFVLGQIKFDKKLITAPPSAGGLGMISVSNYIAALHCSWVKKAFASQIDNWRHDLYSMAGENINMVSPRLVGMQERVQLPVPAPVRGPVPVDANIRQPLPVQSPNKHPVLKSLSESFTKFKNAFYTIGRNFFLSRFGENPRLINNRREKIPVVLSEIFPNLSLDTIKKIELTKIEQLTKDGINFESYENFCATIDINITVNNFASLNNIVKDSWMAIKKISESENSIELETFVSRFKKGSKPFRKIMDEYDIRNFKISNNKRVKTFFRLIGIPVLGEESLKVLYSEWKLTYYSTRLREFIFKFRNNILGLNTRVAHFNANVRRGCKFCVLNRLPVIPDEDFLHLFFLLLQDFLTAFYYLTMRTILEKLYLRAYYRKIQHRTRFFSWL